MVVVVLLLEQAALSTRASSFRASRCAALACSIAQTARTGISSGFIARLLLDRSRRVAWRGAVKPTLPAVAWRGVPHDLVVTVLSGIACSESL